MIVKEFINEKLQNFIKFTNEVFKDNKNILEKFEPLKKLEIEQFILYVNTYIKTYKDDLEGFIDKLCSENKFDKSKLEKDKLEKFKKYLTMFCEIC